MDSQLPNLRQYAAPLTKRAQLERMSEPWALNRSFAIILTMILAIVLGAWVASGQFEWLIIVGVGFAAAMIIIFVRDYWWSPLLIITAFSFQTDAAGFPLTGMEIGVVILALTFPVKMAMKNLRKAEPEMDPGWIFWALLTFMVLQAVVVLFHAKMDGVSLKNIIKSYYTIVVPLAFYGLLIRYCQTHTVKPTIYFLFFTSLFTVAVSIVTMFAGIEVPPLTALLISFGWLDPEGALFILRSSGPYLVIGSLAFWPASRGILGKVVLAAGMVIGLLGTLAGGGRMSLVVCIAAGVFFAAIRRKLWLAIPFAVFTILASYAISSIPGLYNELPPLIQRTIAPLNFSQQGAQANEDLSSSDDWHRDLRNRSLGYWTQDYSTFFFGHGFKAWDPSMTMATDVDAADIERLTQIAIEMGRTENMFSSITNIFGLTGLLLYGGLLCSLTLTLFKARRLSPAGSDARALCEFSLVNLIASIVFCPIMGYVPTLNLICWVLGLLAARPYMGAEKQAEFAGERPQLPAFARPAFAEHPVVSQPRGFRRSRA